MRTFGYCLAVLMLGVWLASTAAAGTQERQLTVAWSELPSLISGRKITLVLNSSGTIEGKVLGLEADALVLRISKSRPPGIYAKGPAAVARSAIAEIHLRQARYRWRVIGTAVGAAAGFALGWLAALLICYDESPGCMRPAVAALVGSTGGMASLGHLAGRELDRRLTIIRISSPPSSDHPRENTPLNSYYCYVLGWASCPAPPGY